MNYRYCYNLLVKYSRVVKYTRGLMSINEFGAYLDLKPTPILAKLFNIYDRVSQSLLSSIIIMKLNLRLAYQDNVGFIHYRQFLIGQLIIMEYLNNKKNLQSLFSVSLYRSESACRHLCLLAWHSLF